MGNHYLPRIIPCSELSTGHHDREASKKGFKHCLKKILWYLSHQQSLIVHPSWVPDISPSTILSPLLKIPAGPLSMTKDAGGGTATLCCETLARLSTATAATIPACSALALLVTNMSAIDVDRLLHDFWSTNPSPKWK